MINNFDQRLLLFGLSELSLLLLSRFEAVPVLRLNGLDPRLKSGGRRRGGGEPDEGNSVVNFTNILKAAFAPILFCQKITKPSSK